MKSRRERQRGVLVEGLESRVMLSAAHAVAAVSKLVITQQPVSTKAGVLETVKVTLENSAGSVVTTANDSVTLKIATGPSGGNLFGTVTVKAVHGVATFNNFSFGKIGTYSVKAVDGSTSSAASSKVNVALGAAAKLKIVSIYPQDTAARLASGSLGPIVVQVLDAGGNVVTGPTLTLTNSTKAGWTTAGTFRVNDVVTQTQNSNGTASVATGIYEGTDVKGNALITVTSGTFDNTDVIRDSATGGTLTAKSAAAFATSNLTVTAVLNTTLQTATTPRTLTQVATGSATAVNGVSTISLAATSTTTTTTTTTTTGPVALGLKAGYYTLVVTEGTLSQSMQIYLH